MRGAAIAAVFTHGIELAVQTEGAPCGETLTIFVIEDGEIRDRLTKVLVIGAKVHDAMWLEV